MIPRVLVGFSAASRDAVLAGGALAFGAFAILIAYRASSRGWSLGIGFGEIIVVVVVLVFAACGLMINRLDGQTLATLGGGAFGYVVGRTVQELKR
jgi:hypothetical protein